MQLTKYINALSISASYIASMFRLTPYVWGHPFSVGLELTNRCNLRCPECASGSGLLNRETGFMSEDMFDSVLSQLEPYMINTMFYFQGESMLHPLFFDFLEKSRRMGVIISSNGHFIKNEDAMRLAGSGARKIIISMDGFSQDTYSKYRMGGNLDTVKSGVIELVNATKVVKKSPDIVLQVLVNRHNEHEIESLKEFAKSLGIKIVMKSMQILGGSDTLGLLPVSRRFNRYMLNQGTLIRKRKLRNRCFRLWTNPVLTWDGRVVPCCFDKNADYKMGDLKESSFKDIWEGEKYNLFRKEVLRRRADIPICRNCNS